MSKASIVIQRIDYEDKQTLGSLSVFDPNKVKLLEVKCLEREWANNKQNESCIPAMRYKKVVFEYSDRFKRKLWEIYGVPGGRTECKIHTSNFFRQLNGCIAPGLKHLDIDGDGYRDVTSSGPTLKRIHKVLKPYENEGIELDIISGCGGCDSVIVLPTKTPVEDTEETSRVGRGKDGHPIRHGGGGPTGGRS